MRVLFYTFEPFVLAQGAREIQITRTCEALKQLDVEVEFLRWYDGGQRGDVLHFFGRISTDLLGLARNSGMKVVVTDWLSEQASRSAVKLKFQRWLICIFERTLPRVITENLHWRSYRLADA